jgi:imidazolonepropionase-like amidohydrolase
VGVTVFRVICRALAAAGLALALASNAEAQPKAETVTVYRHAKLIDGTGSAPRKDMAVVVRGERIASVLADADLKPADLAGARVVDLSGKYLLPGLIDSHEHLATPPDRKRAEATLRRDLYGGVTAIRDMADDLRAVAELARASRVGEIPAPDIYSAALFAGPSFFVDPRTEAANAGVTPGTAPWMQAVTDATDLRMAVARAQGTSATAIKIYANLPGPLVAKIAAEAHRQGMQVWAHSAVFPATPVEVLAAGPDVVSHTCYLAYQVTGVPASYQERTPVDPTPFVRGDNPVVGSLFAEMVRRGIILDATVRVYVEGDKRAAKPSLCTAELATILTRQAWRAGVQLSTGTDGTAPRESPWPAVYDELELLAGKVGMPPLEVIRSATLIGARATGQEADMGTVAPGKLANLIVLAKDPLATISNIRSIELTVKRGREYPRVGYRPITPDEAPDEAP